MPMRAGVPVVVTLHDATFFTDRRLHSGVKGRFFRGWTRISLRQAAVCVVPSQATADELSRTVAARPERLVVAHHGVDAARFHPPSRAEVSAAAAQLGLPDGGWIAFLGTLEPRKNVPALIRAYARVAGRDESVPPLVLAGSAGWDQAIQPAIAAVPEGVRVLLPGHLPVGVLAGFLGGAELVVYPSLGEGFGLPVLEAMACGGAVLTTKRLSLPEVGGDAVAYTDVGAGDIAAALQELLADEPLRSRLRVSARERAATFTWQATAAAHQRAYAQAARAAR
jgi:glycosyltransferase involved in cell wall biosynthesis